MPPKSDRRRSDQPTTAVGGSTAHVEHTPALAEMYLTKNSTKHITMHPVHLVQYRGYLDREWGVDKWIPPRSWFQWAGQEKARVSDTDMCDIRAMTVIARQRREWIPALDMLYKPSPCGFMHKAASPGGSGIPHWRASTAHGALKLMREYFAQPPLVQTITPPRSVRRGVTSRNPGTPVNSPITPTNSTQNPIGLSNNAVNAGVGPSQVEHVSLTTQEKALQQLRNPNHILDVDVIAFIQTRTQALAPGNANLIHPEYFKALRAPKPYQPWNKATVDNLVKGIQQSKVSYSAVYHSWGHGHWTLLKILSNEDTKTVTFCHYDPAPAHQSLIRTCSLKDFLESWTKNNFNQWRHVWKIMAGPQNENSTLSGVLVMLALKHCLAPKDSLPNSWHWPNTRAYLKDSLKLSEDPRTPCSDSDSPQSDDSGVFFDRSDRPKGSRHVPAWRAATMPSPSSIEQGTEQDTEQGIEQGIEESPRMNRARSHTLALLPEAGEIQPPRKRVCQRTLDNSTVKNLSGLVPVLEKLKQMAYREDLHATATATLATAVELEGRIKNSNNVVKKQEVSHGEALRDRDLAKAGEAALDGLLQKYIGAERPGIPSGIDATYRDAVVAVTDEAIVAVESMLIKKIQGKQKAVEDAKEAMHRAMLKKAKAQSEMAETGKELDETTDYMTVIAQCMLLKNPATDFSRALGVGLSMDRMSARGALIGLTRNG
ncbi:hypothetical protein EDB80DRAFT_865129 [Ilyonectria destructans]|nr:hypothetical protein EDB80DRAFT_865129 [Ilyonectria destructans]